MSPVSPHRKLYEYVVEEVGRRIVQGRYGSEETLPNEDLLCRQFGVSRGVLREAAKVLTQKGLIRVRPKIGTQVQPQSHWNLFDQDVLQWKLETGRQGEFFKDVTEVRRVIESEAARLTALRADADEIAAIESSFWALADSLADETAYDYDAYLVYDMTFHTAIMEASHNALLSQIGRTMRLAVQTARRMDVRDYRMQRDSLPYHAAIVEALGSRRPDSAYRASQELFDQVQRHPPGSETTREGSMPPSTGGC
jgi:DNA-binding FadR family transcriptional regulator